MAELRFEAPLASFENEEEWNAHDNLDSPDSNCANVCDEGLKGHSQNTPQNGTIAENFRETCSGSLEDLVNSFDERISNCFCNFEEQVEKIAPVQVRSQEDAVTDCQMWWTITGNYGSILPINWSKSYAQQLQSKVLQSRDRKTYMHDDICIDGSDDEDLSHTFDMQSLIVASLHHEDEDRVESAEDVIRQIENMLKEPAVEASNEDGCTEVSEDEECERVKMMTAKLSTYTESELKEKSSRELEQLMAELQQGYKELSEVLASEQALQDQLDFDKELRNSFISLLLSLQKKLRDSNADRKKKKKGRNSHGPMMVKDVDSVVEDDNLFLTTVIPYNPQEGPPTSEQLQTYIKILEAISENSATVPALLTDYILKVLCPAH